MSLALQRLFDVFSDSQYKYQINVQTRKETILRYSVGMLMFLAILVNLSNYMQRAQNISCEEMNCHGKNTKTHDNCTWRNIEHSDVSICVSELSLKWSSHQLPIQVYSWYPYILIILTLILFAISKFEVSQYAYKEQEFLKIINSHFDPSGTGAAEDFKRVIRGDPMEHQQEARDCLSLFGRRLTIYRTDSIRYVVGFVAAITITIFQLFLGIIYIQMYGSQEGLECKTTRAARCNLSSLRAYASAAFSSAFLTFIYFVTTLHFCVLLRRSRRFNAIKDKLNKSYIVENGDTTLMVPLLDLTYPSLMHIFSGSSTRTTFYGDQAGESGTSSTENDVESCWNDSKIEVQHMVSKLCIANECDVGVYCLAKFHPRFDLQWKVTGLKVELIEENRSKLSVSWNNAPILMSDNIDPEAWRKIFSGSPKYYLYIYDGDSLIHPTAQDPLQKNGGDKDKYCVEFSNIPTDCLDTSQGVRQLKLTPGSDYTVAVCTKLGNYFITCEVKRKCLDPPEVRFDVKQVGETYVDVSWWQLPQALYNIANYSLEVTDTESSKLLKSVEFDPFGKEYKYRIEELTPNKEYNLKLITTTKGSSKSQYEVKKMTNEANDK